VARVVIHDRNLDRVDASELLWRLARAVRDDAKRIVPVRTGRLRASIGITDPGRERVVIDATAPYAGYVELGTRYMRAQPYLRPALYRTRSPQNTPR
jgi:HK97 gp10 family phage protein